MKKQKNKQRQNGITLIALVVTIIVLIILAGVSINMLVGDNGIITQAQTAKEKTDKSRQNEMLDLSNLNDDIDIATGNKIYISQIDCWGDSLTAGAGGNGTTYPSILSSLLGNNYEVTNYGVGGENSITIAGRQGGIPYIVENDFNIPADTSPVSISITSLNHEEIKPLLQGDIGINNVIIGGIEGKLSYSEGNYYFQREEAGEIVPVNSGEEIVTQASRNNQNHTLIIWMGQNGGFNNDANTLIEQYHSMIEKNGNDNYIIIGIPTGTADSRQTLEDAMQTEFGNHYINIRAYMTQGVYEEDVLISCQGLIDANLEPLSGDLELIKQGTIPQALRNDNTHGNSAYYIIVAQQVYKRGIELRYWSSRK